MIALRSNGACLPMITSKVSGTDSSRSLSVIACPVDYSENLRLTDALGELSGPF